MSLRRALVGDPGSVSRAGSVAARGGGQLAQAADGIRPALGELDGWVGSAARATRAHTTAVDRAATIAFTELSTVGSLLQVHATALAGALGAIQAIVVRAEAEGLRVDGEHVVPAPGLRGEAHAADERRALMVQQTLDAELAKLLREFRGARTQLRTALRRSQDRLTEAADTLRRGTDVR